MNTDTRMRFLRYLAVGAINTAFGFGMYVLLLAVGLHFTVAAALVFRFVSGAALPKFVAVYVALYFVNISGIALLKILGASDLSGGFLMLPISAVLGYALNSRFVFRSTHT